MQRLPVDSTDLVSIGYDESSRTLEIEFKENRIYQYHEVTPDIYKGFMKADSYGQYFYAFVNGHYRYKRVKDEPAEAKPAAVAFVTGNASKFKRMQEACEPLGVAVEQLDLPVDEIQSHDPQKIAQAKAKLAYKLAKRPVVVTDVFWNILALRGFPGAYMSYVAEWLKPEDFLALMANKKDRTVMCTRTLIYFDGKKSKVFNHDMIGTMVDAPRGTGNSIEQIVVPPGETRTVAELDAAGLPVMDPAASPYHAFAKWYHMQQRMRLV
jgi:non-canonical purine NTP pyrophosphatase (RdgB/HAM1 family)